MGLWHLKLDVLKQIASRARSEQMLYLEHRQSVSLKTDHTMEITELWTPQIRKLYLIVQREKLGKYGTDPIDVLEI